MRARVVNQFTRSVNYLGLPLDHLDIDIGSRGCYTIGGLKILWKHTYDDQWLRTFNKEESWAPVFFWCPVVSPSLLQQSCQLCQLFDHWFSMICQVQKGASIAFKTFYAGTVATLYQSKALDD